MGEHRFSLVACARWEEQAILEWLDYHKSVGFDHVYLWSNDDEPETLRRAVAPHLSGEKPFVTYNHWAERGKQGQIYEHFLTKYSNETEWFCFLDIDEFLVFRGLNNVHEFMEPIEKQFSSVYFHWVTFGPDGRAKREPGSVLVGHTKRNKGLDFHTKNLVRSSKVSIEAVRTGNHCGARPYFHFWDDYHLPGLRICNVLGEEIVDYTKDFPAQAHAFCQRPGYQERVFNTAYCAHFQFKSEEDFLRRVERGGNSSQEHWKRMYEEGRHKALLAAHNEVTDRYLATYWAPRQSVLDSVRRALTFSVAGAPSHMVNPAGQPG